MAYLEKVIDRGNVIEAQKYINGRYGIREKREKAAAQRATPEEQLRWQSKEAVRKVWRLLRDKQNFQPGDLWVTLTYPAKSTPDSDTVKKNIKEFLKRIRKKYRQDGKECKYIFSVGRGKRGAIHLHMILTKIDTEIIATNWQNIVNGGEWVHVHASHLDKTQNWYSVAAYIIKNGEETFLSDDPIIKKRFSSSHNLREATPKARVVHAKTWRKEPPERKGYYIDKNLSYSGVNRYGYPMQYTVYVKLEGKQKNESQKGGGTAQHVLCWQKPRKVQTLQDKNM